MNDRIANSIDEAVDNAYAAGLADGQRIVAARLAAVEALGQDGSPGSLMEDIRAELIAVTGDPGMASACNTRVMHQVREHLRAALAASPSEVAP